MWNAHKMLNSPTLHQGNKTDGQSRWSHCSLSHMSGGSKRYQVLSDMTEIKGHVFASDLQDDEKHLYFFPSTVDSFNSQFHFHERHQVAQTTQLKKKKKSSPPSFILRTVRSKDFLLKAKQVGFSPLYLQVKQTCTLYFHSTQSKWTETSSLCLVHAQTCKAAVPP